MDIGDYYAKSATSNVAYGLGRGARTVQVVAERINPLKAATAVMVGWGSIAGLANYRRYKQGRLTKREAIAVTANESVGMGLAAAVGLFADGLVRTYVLATATPSLIPFAIGVAMTGTAKITWDCVTKKNMMWCGVNGTRKTVSAPDASGRDSGSAV